MNTNHVSDDLHDYLDGTLPASEMERITLHLNSCTACSQEFASLKTIIDNLKTLPNALDVPPDFNASLERKLDAAPQRKINNGAGTGLRFERGAPGNVPDATHADARDDADKRPARAPRFWYLRAAAILAVCFTAGTIWWMLKPPERDMTASDEVNTPSVEAPLSKDDTATPDASTIARAESVSVTNGPRHHSPARAGGKGSARDQLTGRADALAERSVSPDDNRSVEVTAAAPSATTAKVEAHTASGVLSGRVTDATTGEPLIGANVLIVGTMYGTSTDIDGKFVIPYRPVGPYTLRVTFLGYDGKVLAQVAGSTTDTSVLNVTLNPSGVEMAAVAVPIPADKLSTNSVQTVSPATIDQLPDVNSVGDVMRMQAGKVKQGQNMYMRGGRADGTANLPQATMSAPARTQEQEFHTEEYGRIYENGFLDVMQNPLSTFSVDVDAASYANVRRFINDGMLPPKDAVRIEEMINYFEYDYPEPDGDDPFSVTTEVVRCPWNRDNHLVLVGLQGKSVNAEDMPPGNLVFLIDVSGSMNSPNKLPLVKSAFRMLVQQLRPEDRVSIVVYAGNAGLVLPSTGGRHKSEILSAIDRLEAGGSTAGGEGLRLAYDVARENFRRNGNNRVILATDGDFNVGISSTSELVRFIEERRDEGIFLSVLGFGTDNLKDDRMQQLADKGNGAHYYIDNIQEARRVFVGQLTGTLLTIAKDVKVQIEFNPAAVGAYRLIGYENRLLAKEDFNDDRKDAGDIGAGHRVTAMYEIVPAGEEVELPRVDSLKYQRSVSRRTEDELLTLKLRYKEPESSKSRLITTVLPSESMSRRRGSENIRFAAAVAEFGMLLRDSEFKGTSSYDDVLDLARGAMGHDRDGYKEEFLKLVEGCKRLQND